MTPDRSVGTGLSGRSAAGLDVETSPAALNQGPACRNCRSTEARCAWRQGCCSACSHWIGYDAAGNPHANPRPQREHGTERGFQQHRYRKDPPCIRCCRAHSAHVVRQRRAS